MFCQSSTTLVPGLTGSKGLTLLWLLSHRHTMMA